jgi:hypothetical protein
VQVDRSACDEDGRRQVDHELISRTEL